MEITELEIRLYEILIDEIGMEAEDLIIRKCGPEKAAALIIAYGEHLEKFYDEWN